MAPFERPGLLWVALLYLAAVLAIGVWSAARTRNARDFFIAGQRVGLLVTGLATMSAAFSGFVFLGGPGLTYQIGTASLMIVLPLAFTGGLLCWTVARKLRLLAGIRELYTVPDAIACRYDSRLAAGLAAVAVVAGTIAYLGLQLQALGLVLRGLFGIDAGLAFGLGIALLLAYSVMGGMLAGVYTDLLQGGLMLVAAVAVGYRAVAGAGGVGTMLRSIATSPEFGPAFLEPLGRAPALTAFGFFFVFGVGVLGQPHMLHKFYMLDDPAKLRWMPLVLGAGQATCVLIWLGIGLAVPALVAQGRLAPLADADDASIRFLLEFTPDLLAGLAFAGILAAIMSTADSFLNIGAAALVRDLPRALGHRVDDELRWGRLAVLLTGGVAAVFAYARGELIAVLGTFAFGTFAAALAPCLAIGLNWGRVTARAASASIATGLVLNVGLEIVGRWGGFLPLRLAPGALPAATALAASFLVLFAVTLCDRGRGEAMAEDVRAIVDS